MEATLRTRFMVALLQEPQFSSMVALALTVKIEEDMSVNCQVQISSTPTEPTERWDSQLQRP